MSDTNISGIFILQEVRERILNDLWPTKFIRIHNYAWFGAGQLPGGPQSSRIERISFNDDTVQASFRGSLTLTDLQGRGRGLAASGNDFYGWFAGGFPNSVNGTISRVDRIIFVADSSTTSIRGPLSSARYGLTATSNENFGWFGGGRGSVSSPVPSTTVSTIERIDFAVDSATASVRGPLSSAKRELSSTGTENFGWFGGGDIPVTSTVDRITFASDTVTASVRGPLSSAKKRLAATGNKDSGWFGGGESVSTIDRVNFAADTTTASVRGPLSSIIGFSDAAGNINFGWFGGGSTPSAIFSTLVNRITFNSDTNTASVRGPLSSGRYALAAVSGFI